jgi:superfamily II DNA or RNA helicase
MSDLDDLMHNDQVVTELFGDMEARWYQSAIKTQAEQILKLNPMARIIIKSPTGSGKTVTSGLVLLSPTIKTIVSKDGVSPLRVLFITHKHRLKTQAERAFESDYRIQTVSQANLSQSSMAIGTSDKIKELLATEVDESTLFSDHSTEVYYQSAFQSIPSNVEFDLVVIDEVHHEAMASIQYLLDQIDTPIIGLTATDTRADGCLIKFTHTIEPISREQAVDEGWLAKTNIYSFVDTSGTDKTHIGTAILQEYASLMGQTLVFVKTKKEIATLTQVLLDLGFAAIGVLNQTGPELDAILDDFSAGRIQFIVNCNKLSEGIDVKNCQTVLLLRLFGSYSQLNQAIGRAARPDSVCNVFELINPLSGRNLDATTVVGIPEAHDLFYVQRGKWVRKSFNYVGHRTNKQLGLAA